jgi:hypothetical protein
MVKRADVSLRLFSGQHTVTRLDTQDRMLMADVAYDIYDQPEYDFKMISLLSSCSQRHL